MDILFPKTPKMLLQPVSTEHIAIEPDYCFGKPRIAGTRMPVATIAQLYLEMGESLEEIAKEYDLSLLGTQFS